MRNFFFRPRTGLFLTTLVAALGLTSSLSSCATRFPSEIDSATVSSSDWEPFKPQVFQERLYEAAKTAVGRFSEQDMQAFFDQDALRALAAADPVEFWSNQNLLARLDWALEHSKVSPVWLTKVGMGRIGTGGLVLVGPHVFPEGYFRNFAGTMTTHELVNKSPWFRFDTSRQTFVPTKGGGAEVILQQILAWTGARSFFF